MMNKKFFTGLSLFGALCLSPFEAKAVPDPVFNPILGNIQNSLPRGMVMRLPSKLRLYGYQNRRIYVYPKIQRSDTDELAIALHSEPDCQANYCLLGFLTVEKVIDPYFKALITEEIGSWKPYKTNRNCGVIKRKNVSLVNSIQGILVEHDRCGNGSLNRSSSFIWKQDGYFFTVRIGTHKLNSIVDIARSMASEPPIRSSL